MSNQGGPLPVASRGPITPENKGYKPSYPFTRPFMGTIYI